MIESNMFMVTHAAVGALVGGVVGSGPLAFTLGFISHFLMDMIPHGDEFMMDEYKSRNGSRVRKAVAYVTIDAIATIMAILVMLSNAPAHMHDAMKWGIIGGVLPDLMVGIYEATKLKILRAYSAWHHRNHHHIIGKYRHGRDIPFKWGVAYQVVAAILLLKIAVV